MRPKHGDDPVCGNIHDKPIMKQPKKGMTLNVRGTKPMIITDILASLFMKSHEMDNLVAPSLHMQAGLAFSDPKTLKTKPVILEGLKASKALKWK